MAKDAARSSSATEDGRKLPFTKEQVFHELREIILREGGRINLMRGPAATKAFLGFDYEADEHDDGRVNYKEEYLSQIELEEFELARNFDLAYDYAFQVGRWIKFNEVIESRLRGITHAIPEWGVEGTPNPYFSKDSKCRHVAELATARYHLTHYHISPTIDQLALLANMTDAAVRNSLSQENIKAEGPAGQGRMRSRLGLAEQAAGIYPQQDA